MQDKDENSVAEQQKKREVAPQQLAAGSAKLSNQGAGSEQNLSAIFMGLQKLTKEFSGKMNFKKLDLN